ncbi:hypothetical protein C8D77_111152 [Mesorhizobium loti]|uniref:Uncharacterized protein n=1 Tax=Rhizobium loti TaxID=381 RepID=A0A8E2W8D9_RHILI|nr:hypothetical protein [Mesorhizobium loti]PWJ88429.1 hypothetical protein C8D77_111152 [Mesorhizobium loti]
MKRASYCEIAVLSGYVFIADRFRPDLPTVATDAERVVVDLLSQYGERRFVYRDREGGWTELLHTGIQFRGFAPFVGEIPGEERAA